MDVNTKAGDFRVYMYFEAAWAYETPEHGKARPVSSLSASDPAEALRPDG